MIKRASAQVKGPESPLSRRGAMVAARLANSIPVKEGARHGRRPGRARSPAARGDRGRRERCRPLLVGCRRPALPPLPRHRVGPAGRRGPTAVREALPGGFQAGLSWLTILRKRERFREVFAGFDPAVVARFGTREVDRLLADPGIVRNRAKIEATINNAGRYGELAA